MLAFTRISEIIWLIADVVIFLAIYKVRRKGWNSFGHWWDGEGLPILFIFIILNYLLLQMMGVIVETEPPDY